MLRGERQRVLRNLLGGIGKDPAMLIYLDNRQNVKGHPNEICARDPRVVLAGRGQLYGEGHSRKRRAPSLRLEPSSTAGFMDRANLHTTARRLSSARRQFQGEDIVDIILQQPAARIHCAHLYRFFGREITRRNSRTCWLRACPDKFEIAPFLEQFSFPRISTAPRFRHPDQDPGSWSFDLQKLDTEAPTYPSSPASPARSTTISIRRMSRVGMAANPGSSADHLSSGENNGGTFSSRKKCR